MKCPGCGCESLDLFGTCERCGPAAAGPARLPGSRVDRGGDLVETLDDDAVEVGEDDLARELSLKSVSNADYGPSFQIDDDFFVEDNRGVPELPRQTPGAVEWAEDDESWLAVGASLPAPVFVLPGEERGAAVQAEPIIERDEEVPDSYWAPEVAGLAPRALALLVDQLLVLAILGIFFLGALAALQYNGLTSGLFLDAAGLQASALPFTLLAAVLSLVYCIFFHGSTGRTPGKALVGIEVRAGDGGAVTWGRAVRRWVGAAIGLGCAGLGVFWAIFEPRRRGWADLISGTVVARPQRVPAPEIARR